MNMIESTQLLYHEFELVGMIWTLFLVFAVWLCFHIMLTTFMFCFLISWMEVDLTAWRCREQVIIQQLDINYYNFGGGVC